MGYNGFMTKIHRRDINVERAEGGEFIAYAMNFAFKASSLTDVRMQRIRESESSKSQ